MALQSIISPYAWSRQSCDFVCGVLSLSVFRWRIRWNNMTSARKSSELVWGGGGSVFTPVCCFVAAEESDGDSGVCGTILMGLSWVLIIFTLPFSLCVCFKVGWHVELWQVAWYFALAVDIELDLPGSLCGFKTKIHHEKKIDKMKNVNGRIKLSVLRTLDEYNSYRNMGLFVLCGDMRP